MSKQEAELQNAELNESFITPLHSDLDARIIEVEILAFEAKKLTLSGALFPISCVSAIIGCLIYIV